MALSLEEKDRIAEEETLRFETRMKAQNRAENKGAICVSCGHKPVCGGCRIWATVLGLLLLFLLFRSFACTHEDRCRFYGYGEHSAMGRWDQSQVDATPVPAAPVQP